jgi:DNA-binding NtrC family response regulator/tetratricopeptide (TPR) repeat protein
VKHDPLKLVEQAQAVFHSRRDEAARLAQAALKLGRAGGNLGAVARALNLLADVARVEGRIEDADAAATEALDAAQQAGDRHAWAGAINLLGLTAWHRGEFDLAISKFEDSLSLFEELKDDLKTGNVRSNLSLMYWEKGDLVQAMEEQRRALEIRMRIDDRSGMGVSHLNMGLVHLDLGDWDQALESYFRALVQHEAIGDKVNMAMCFNNIGDLYLKRGKPERAMFHLKQALELTRETGSSWVEAEVLGNMGEAAFVAGRFAEAEAYYEQDRAICERNDDREELAETLRRRAELDLAREEFDSARERLESALAMCTRAGSRREEGNVRRVSGELFAARGDAEQAQAALTESVSILRSLGRNYELGRALLVLGRLLAGSGQGAAELTEARAIFRAAGVLRKADEAGRLLDQARLAGEQVDLLQNLTALACRGDDVVAFCDAALAELTGRLGLAGAAVFMRDGRVFRHGQRGEGLRSEEGGLRSVSVALEAAGKRIGTLVLQGEVSRDRIEPLVNVLALGILQARPVSKPTPAGKFPDVIGADSSLRQVFDTVERVAPTRASVLILGESGTGKEVVARSLHRLSDRCDQPFVAVNCAAIPETLLESELFGIEAGTATGVTGRPGKFETAQGGTLFLDEIGDMSPALQAKMLRVLQDRTFERVGGRKTITADVRVVAATNRDIEQALATGQFRQDLYYRLNVISLTLPPLRERRQDIPALVDHFAGRFAREYGKPANMVTDDCLAALTGYHWPGNVRELENVIERGVILARGDKMTCADLPQTIQGSRRPAPAESGLGWQEVRKRAQAAAAAPVERSTVLQALEKCGWVAKRAAQQLGISRTHLYRMMRKYDIKRPPRDA